MQARNNFAFSGDCSLSPTTELSCLQQPFCFHTICAWHDTPSWCAVMGLAEQHICRNADVPEKGVSFGLQNAKLSPKYQRYYVSLYSDCVRVIAKSPNNPSLAKIDCCLIIISLMLLPEFLLWTRRVDLGFFDILFRVQTIFLLLKADSHQVVEKFYQPDL